MRSVLVTPTTAEELPRALFLAPVGAPSAHASVPRAQSFLPYKIFKIQEMTPPEDAYFSPQVLQDPQMAGSGGDLYGWNS